ncbi:hypothetical protein B0H14DRAFT_1172409 [Mycena olivaceomarginata]|nr:hypothetical protein B0H14DRAFT_1172409 [Mycena olivaceomarginata]
MRGVPRACSGDALQAFLGELAYLRVVENIPRPGGEHGNEDEDGGRAWTETGTGRPSCRDRENSTETRTRKGARVWPGTGRRSCGPTRTQGWRWTTTRSWGTRCASWKTTGRSRSRRSGTTRSSIRASGARARKRRRRRGSAQRRPKAGRGRRH